MNRIHLASALVLALAACTTGTRARAPSSVTYVNERGEKVRCKMERPLGSNIAEMVCKTEQTLATDSQAAQDAMRSMPKSGASPANN